MRAGCGCFLMLVSFVLLFALVVIPVIPQTAETRSIDDYLKLILCEPNQRLIRDQYSTTDFDGTGYSMTVFCETSKNVREDVTAKWTLISIGAFVAPFIVGLLLFIVGVTRRAMRAAGNVVNMGGLGTNPQVMVTRYGGSTSPIEGLDINDGTLRMGGVQIATGFSPEQAEAFRRQIQDSTFVSDTPSATAPAETLAQKLKQIQEARDAGLISTDEYDRLRKEILDNMG